MFEFYCIRTATDHELVDTLLLECSNATVQQGVKSSVSTALIYYILILFHKYTNFKSSKANLSHLGNLHTHFDKPDHKLIFAFIYLLQVSINFIFHFLLMKGVWIYSVLKGSKFIISVHLISNVFAEQNQFPINSHCICVLWFDLEACGETPFGSTGTQRGRWCWGEVELMCQKCYCVRLIYWVSFTSPNVPRYLFP